MNGILYGIGVGTGDPEDITLKAVRLIKESDVLVFPRKDLNKCRAYQIVLQAVPEIEQKEIIATEFDMAKNAEGRIAGRQKAYMRIKEYIEAGQNVAFLTIGDPSLYSTYSYIAGLAASDGITTYSVSGTPSITACANALGISLCEGNEQLHIISDTDDIVTALDLPGTRVIMKCGMNLPQVKSILGKRDRLLSVYAVSDCGTEREKCYRGIDELPDKGNYMLTIIVKDRK